MLEQLNEIEKKAMDALNAVQDPVSLDAWRVAHVGRSSPLMQVFAGLGKLSKEERPGVGAAAKPQYKKGGTQKVGKWTCDVYEISLNNQRTGELCTVSPQALGFTAADFEVSRKLADFMRSILPQGADAMFQVGGADVGFSGVPVRSISTVFGRETITEMTDVSRQEVADALFTVPSGFTKEAFGGIGGLGGGRGAPPR